MAGAPYTVEDGSAMDPDLLPLSGLPRDTRLDRRYRVTERRDIRESVRLGVLVGAVVLTLDMLTNGLANTTILVVDAVGVLGLLLLLIRPVRKHPHAAGFAMLVTLTWVTILPEFPTRFEGSVLPGYLALIIVGSAVFLPWSRGWHAAWLAVAAASSLLTAAVTSTTPDALGRMVVVIVASVATSAGGNMLIRRRRERVHLQQVALHAQRAQLRRLSAELRDVALRDSLTGLGNRRRLTEDIAEFEARLARGVLPGVSAIMIDLDHFKAYNDRAGHPAGDEVLRVVADAVRGAVREVDRVYRYGGEELLVLLEEPTAEGAMLAARRILDAVRRLSLPHVAQPGHAVTVSAGAASQSGTGVQVWHVIEAADQALYEAKRAGRDRAVPARPLAPARGPEPAERPVRQSGIVESDSDPGFNPGPSPRVRLPSSAG